MEASGGSKRQQVPEVAPHNPCKFAHGFWMLTDDRELFVPFDEFPWFKRASVESILRLERPTPGHLHWPELDVDLSLDSMEHPEQHPLTSKL